MNYVEPHKKISREVTQSDINLVLDDVIEMMELCIKPPDGRYGAYAIAHAQVNDIDPLRFFVTNSQKIFINPVITRHTQVPVESMEGCTTYTKDKPQAKKQRYHKCDVTFYTIDFGNNKTMIQSSASISGLEAKIFQHEIDHMNGIYIYD